MKKYLLILIWWVIQSCAKEYSCEGCYHPPTIDTAYNDLITHCNIYIENNSEVRYIYPQVKTKLWPGHYWIFDSIPMNSTPSSIYKRTYDLKKYLQIDKYQKGDSFFVRYEIRYKFRTAEFVGEDTLIY